MKRWDRMSKDFTRIGKEIVMAVKEGGPNPDTNARLRTAMQNGKGVNMPKDRVEAAIKRATGKDEKDYQEVVYEGYGPHGVAIVVETATDNPTRTVSNVRLYFTRNSGALGTAGSSDYTFTRKGVFKLAAEGLDRDELELELIDVGAEDVYETTEEDEHGAEHKYIVVETAFTDFGQMQQAPRCQRRERGERDSPARAQHHRFAHRRASRRSRKAHRQARRRRRRAGCIPHDGLT